MNKNEWENEEVTQDVTPNAFSITFKAHFPPLFDLVR